MKRTNFICGNARAADFKRPYTGFPLPKMRLFTGFLFRGISVKVSLQWAQEIADPEGCGIKDASKRKRR
jgi:hypothetical protein